MQSNWFFIQNGFGQAVQPSLTWVVSILILVGLSGCSNHSVKRAYLQPSTDLTALPNGSSQDRETRAHSSNKQACSNPYQVVSGDSLSVISARCNIKMSALANANQLQKPYTIRVGQKLNLPGMTASTIRQPQQISAISKHQVPSQTEIRQSYQLADWKWPMEQQLEHSFIRDSAGITGLEINCFPGMRVLAVADGDVVYVGSGIMQFGLMVMLKHPSGHMSVYAHNSQVLVKEGQAIKAGQDIALSGATGLTDRSKVYVEARFKGKKVDVQKLFNGL